MGSGYFHILLALLLADGAIFTQSHSTETYALTVGPNVQVSSTHPGYPHGEVLIAADPRDASHLLACSMFWPEDGASGSMTAVYASFDGGLTWSLALSDSTGADVAAGKFSQSADPACT